MNKIKPITEIRYCQYCGKPLERKHFVGGVRDRWEAESSYSKRVYCDRECMKKAYVAKKSVAKSDGGCHWKSRSIMADVPKVCELCGSTKNVDVHHKDGDYTNNVKKNLMLVCRSCHNKIHREKAECIICGEPMKGHGYCNKHLIRYRKYGNPYWCYGKDEREVIG